MTGVGRRRFGTMTVNLRSLAAALKKPCTVVEAPRVRMTSPDMNVVARDFGDVIVHRLELVDEVLDRLDQQRLQEVRPRRLLARNKLIIIIIGLRLFVIAVRVSLVSSSSSCVANRLPPRCIACSASARPQDPR